MTFSIRSSSWASLPAFSRWRGRVGTLSAMAMLCWARVLVALVPFRRWQASLGLVGKEPNANAGAQSLANMVDRAAGHLPFETKCLPRAMALSWMLQRRQIAHSVVFAVRLPAQRDEVDTLHAWVEVRGLKILGSLPGRWIETLRLPGEKISSCNRPQS
jgi:hypothetical protein